MIVTLSLSSDDLQPNIPDKTVSSFVKTSRPTAAFTCIQASVADLKQKPVLGGWQEIF